LHHDTFKVGSRGFFGCAVEDGLIGAPHVLGILEMQLHPTHV
jgi:hypothetical protein